MAAREDADLWRRYRESGDQKLREAIIVRYAPLVRYVVGRLLMGLPPHQEADELAGYGIFGLLESVDRYDPDRGVKFETYGVGRIRGGILDGLRAYDQAPGSWRRRARSIERAEQELEMKLGRVPEETELAEHLGISREELWQWLGEAGRMSVVSLEEVLFDGSERLEVMPDEREEDPAVLAEFAERKELLGAAIDRLPEKERQVVALYYYEGLTVKEIAEVMHLSPSRISQLHHRAILRLRGRLARAKQDVL